jgi:integrase
MPKRTLNDRIIQSLKVTGKTKDGKPRTRMDAMDSIVPGFGVRVTERGQKTFVLVARFPGADNPTRRALGDYGELTLWAARTKARRWLELIQAGKDPTAEEERAKRETLRKQKHTFALVAEEFIKRHVSKTRKAVVAAREIRREFIDRWATRPITDIDQSDVKAVLRAAVDRNAPYQAHNLLVHIRSLFNWAIAQGDYGLDHSPCDRLQPKMVIGKKAIRTRVLRDDELRLLWKATDDMDYPYGPLFRLLAITGQRKSEVAEARWSEFDLKGKLWTIPSERMKADAAHVVPLTNEAIEILEGLPRFHSGEFLFSTRFGKRPVNGFSKAKARADELMLKEAQVLASRGNDPAKAKLEEWRIHDIRRTMRTALSALPVSDMVRELVIAHTRPGLHKVYDQYAYLGEKRYALELWAERLHSILRPTPEIVAAPATNARG